MIYHIKVHTGECIDVDTDRMKLDFDIYYLNHSKMGFSLKKQYYSPELRAMLFAENYFNGFDGVWYVLRDHYASYTDLVIQYTFPLNEKDYSEN